MKSRIRRWLVFGIAAVLVAGLGVVPGCSQADQPKLADAPPIQAEAAKEPPKIPTQKKAFTEVEGYSKYMSKGGQAGPR